MKNLLPQVDQFLKSLLFFLTATSGTTIFAQSISNISSGGNHSLILRSDGSLLVTGLNSNGQLGDGTTNDRTIPFQIESSDVESIAAGENYSLYMKTDGSLWVMGANTNGQLGDGTTIDRTIPFQIESSDVESIAAGGNHSLFVKTTNGSRSLWVMGSNANGQLGNGTTTDQTTPFEIRDTLLVSLDVKEVAAGGNHSLFVKTDGSLWVMGANTNGQLGDGGQPNDRTTPFQIESSNVESISVGENHSLYLKTDGSLWGIGLNDSGQLGDGGNLTYRPTPYEIESSDVASIAAGGNHSLYLKTDGSLWGMGSNGNGQLGDGTTTDQTTPFEIESSGVESITVGENHSLYLKTDGSLWGMGLNDSGQLGDGTNTDRNTPTFIDGPKISIADLNQSFPNASEDQTFNGQLINPARTSNVIFNKTRGPYRSNDPNKIDYAESFSLAQNGSFSVLGKPDWNGTLVFEWDATIENNNTIISGEAWVTLQAQNDPPVITISDRAQNVLSTLSPSTKVPEQTTDVGYIHVEDDTTFTFDIDLNYADGAKFFIDINSPSDLYADGKDYYPIKINGAGFDFENPTDSGGQMKDGTYVVKLFADDGVNRTEIELEIEVEDVQESPTNVFPSKVTTTIREDAVLLSDVGSWYQRNGDTYLKLQAEDKDTQTVDLTWSVLNQGSHLGVLQWSTDSQMANAELNSITVSKNDPVYLNYLPDGNQSGTDIFFVQVADEDGNSALIDFNVIIDPVDDDAPVFTSLSSTSSNPFVIVSGSSDIFTTLVAMDADDPSSTYRFEIIDGFDKDYFSIDSGTGEIRPNGMISSIADPDEDGDGIYRIRVKATDNVSGETVEQWVYAEINEPPHFVNKLSGEIITEPIKLAITEDQEEITWQAVWDAFGGIEAIDPGTRGAADITVTNWGLDNGSQNGDVIVDGSANSVVYTPYPNEFGNDSFTIFAEDSSNLQGFLTFEITIDSANDQPVVERTDFNSSSNRINVFENQRYVLDFNASDQLDSPEESSSAQQIWEISGTDSKLFYIDDNGSLYFQNLPDREEPLDGDKDNFYEIEIVVSDHPSGSSDPFPIKIQVLNVNEPPVFTDNNLIKVPDPFLEHNGFFTRVDVPEDSFVVYDPNCSDPEGNNNFTYTLGMISDFNITNPDFTIHSASPFEVDAVTGRISLARKINYENPSELVDSTAVLETTKPGQVDWWGKSTDSLIRSGFHLELNATDSGGLTTSHKILVICTDVNEPPEFQSLSSSPILVTEEDQYITTFTATDPEKDIIIYGIEDGNNDDFRNFSINQATGELNFLSSPKNYEEPTDIGKDNIYEIVVFAESGGNLIVSQEVDIQVLNTNDAPTLDRVGSSTIRVKENFSLALAFNATDEDHNFSYPDLVYVVDGQELRYQKHTGQTVGAYSIGTSLHGPNDVGAKSVMVADFNRDGLDDILELNSSNKIRLYLNNGNDTFGIEIPVTDIPLSVGQILVSDLSGDGYPDVVALEKGKQRILGWKWNNDKSNFLPLVTDGNSSEVHVPITNDFDMDLLHIADLNTDGLLDILIDANGSSRLSWIENLGQSNFAKTSHVILSDLNYSNPVHAIDTGDINGDGRVDILLATDDGISIMENDKGLFSEMVFIYNDTNGYPYSIKGVHLDNDDRLDLVASFDRSNLGLQSVSAVLLNTATNSFTIKTDFGEGNLVSSFEAKDLDNDGHMDLMAISNDGYLQFFSNSGNGVMAPVGNKLTSGIGVIYSAKFANFDNRLDDIQFSVSGGKDRDLFEFRPNFSSHLWFKQIPDYESPLANAVPGFGPNEYEVIIEADSIGADGSKKSVEHTLKILVQNENDNPPEFISSIEFSHAENSMQVASLAAVDLDDDSVYWEILEGNETFDLSSDGKLVFKLPPDYESPDIGIVDNQYSVAVRATDSLFQIDQNITVNVINLNDNSPVVHNAELNGVSSIIIEENQFAVLELNITDADQDVGVLSTNFVNEKDSSLFKITQNTSSGNDLIEFKVPPNFEDPSDLDEDNIYTFDLNISDGIHDQIISVFVEVININDEEPVWLVSGGDYNITENQKFVIDLNASDDFQNSIIFSLDNNWPDHEFFDLNQSSGELRFKSGTIPDFENPSDLSPGRSGFIDGVYEIMVDLKDPDHNASSQEFVFTVEDVDEFPSFIIPTLLSEEDDSLIFSQDDFNITDPEGDLFEFTLISNPSNGVLTNLANGEFNYRSKNNFNGTDSISFRITEGGTSQDFAVSINISPKNDFPLLKDDEIDYVLSDRSPVFLDVLKNDSSFPDDENSETLRIVKWEVDFDLSDTVVGDFDWSASLPETGTGPYFEGDQSFNFSPPPNFLGPLTLKYEVSDGNLTASANVFINVTQSPDLPGWRYFDEFGYFFDASNKWILHEKLGWVFVYDISKLLDSATWCWNDGVGWFWTGRPYFDYIFVNEFSKWMRWQGGVNDSGGWSLITDYETNQVVSPEMFQIQRVTSTLSSFTSATEVSDYIRNTEVFTEEQKKEILFELLLYKSSPTLEELGITLSF